MLDRDLEQDIQVPSIFITGRNALITSPRRLSVLFGDSQLIYFEIFSVFKTNSVMLAVC